MKKSRKQPTDLVPIGHSLQGFEKLYMDRVEPVEPTGVWAEPQLYLLPFCVPQDRTAERFRSIKITETVKVKDQVKHRSFMVNPHPELGLPGSFELEVMTGIYRLADLEIINTGAVTDFIELGSFHSFLKLIGRPYSGKYVRMLKEALRRLAGTICISEGFFYSKPRDLYVVESFTFITSLEIVGDSDFNGRTYDKTRVKLHEFIRGNLNSNFRTLIDFDFIRSLKTTIAKSLSLHIAYRVFKNGNSTWEADYSWLAERLAIKTHVEMKRAKDQLKAALTELKETDFIESWEWLPEQRIRFYAGDRLIEMHKKRVAKRDAWLEHQQKEVVQLSFLPARTEREAERLDNYDPLAVLCTKYAVNGWCPSVAAEAKTKALTEVTLRAEAVKRGHSLQSTTPALQPGHSTGQSGTLDLPL